MINQRPPVEAKISVDHKFFSIIEDAYRVFAYPKPTSTDVCERCCLDARIASDFFVPPIRELPLRYVQNWFDAAYSGEGITRETWSYLLPRILEILASGEDASVISLEISLNRFDTGNPKKWSNGEWAILDRFQREFLRYKIESRNDALDDVICMFRLGGWPLDDLLAQVASMPDAILIRRLWQDWCASGFESIWTTAFWERDDRTTVFSFYTSPELSERVEAVALDENTDPELAAAAMSVANVIHIQKPGS